MTRPLIDGLNGRRARLLIALAAASLVARTAAADPEGVSFAWEAPDGCPDRDHVVAEIERLAGRSLGRGEPAAEVRAVVARGERGFSVHIASRSGGALHERTVEAATCKEAAGAAALIVAMALDPALAQPVTAPDSPPANVSPSNDSPSNDSAPAKEPVAQPRAVRSDAAEPPRSIAIRGEGRALFALDAGALPALAPGVAAALGGWLGPFRLDLTGSYFPEQRRKVGGGGGDIGLATAGLGAWFAPLRSPFELSAGLGLEAGAMWGKGFGVAGARNGGAPWLAVLPGIAAAYPFVARLGAAVAARAAIPLLRERFTLGGEELFVPGALSLRLEAGLFARFP